MTIQFNSASVSSTSAADATAQPPQTVQNSDKLELLVADNKIELLIGSCDFLQEPRKALPQLTTACVVRFQQCQQAKAAKAAEGKIAKIWKILFPSTIDKSTARTIHSIGVNAICDFGYRDAASVKNHARQLYQYRVSHPAEFHVALPAIKARDVVVLCNSLLAHATMWEATSEIYNENPDAVERKINRAVKYFHKCGISADDASLNQFREAYLHAANALRAAKQAAAVAVPAA